MKESRAAVAANNIRIFRDLDIAFHTDPADGFGVDYELFEGTFFGPNAMAVTSHARPAEYWRNEHPASFTGPVGYTQAVAKLEPVGELLTNLFGSERAYEADRPALGAKAWGYPVADHMVELLCPTGDGPLMREMMRTGEGIRSTVFGVADVAKARSHFEGLGFPIIDGTIIVFAATDTVAIPPYPGRFSSRRSTRNATGPVMKNTMANSMMLPNPASIISAKFSFVPNANPMTGSRILFPFRV